MRKLPSRLGKPRERLRDGGTWRANAASSSARGYTYEWQRARMAFLDEHPLCVIRGDGCTYAATVVDHIVPHRGNRRIFWDRSNWQSVCTHCHNAHKQRIERNAL